MIEGSSLIVCMARIMGLFAHVTGHCFAFCILYTVIRFVSTSAKFEICTVVDLNGTLVEDKCVHSRVNVNILG